MADETAILEPGTAESVTAPLGEPEEEPSEIAETEQPQTTETEDVQDETPASPFAGKPLDEIAEDPEVQRVIKDRLAKHEESLRQKAEAAQARALTEQQHRQYQELRARAANANAHWAANTLRTALDKAAEDGKPLEPQVADGVAAWLNQRALVDANETVVNVASQYLGRYHPQAKIPQELVTAFNSAQATQDVPGMVMSVLAMVDMANRETIRAEVRAEIEKEQAEAATKEQQLAKEKQAATAARSAPKPVGGSTAPLRQRNTSELLADPLVPSEEKRKAFIAKYGFAP